MLKSVWKNVIGITVLFGVIFAILFFNFKVGFTAFDFTKTTLNSLILLNAFIVFLSIFLTVLIVVFVIFIVIHRKKKKELTK